MQTCPVCLEELDDDKDVLTVPGCNHRLHVRCALDASQYDVRCCVCRRVPEGVVTRATQPGAAEAATAAESPPRDLQILHTVWQRYLARRRRLINRTPSARQASQELRPLRAEMTRVQREASRVYSERCREIWKHDAEVLRLRKQLQRLRRKELRLERVIAAALEELNDETIVIVDEVEIQ